MEDESRLERILYLCEYLNDKVSEKKADILNINQEMRKYERSLMSVAEVNDSMDYFSPFASKKKKNLQNDSKDTVSISDFSDRVKMKIDEITVIEEILDIVKVFYSNEATTDHNNSDAWKESEQDILDVDNSLETDTAVLLNDEFNKKESLVSSDEIDLSYLSLSDDNLETKFKSGLRILETQEVERKRIARELHDSSIQELTNILHKAELCYKLIDIDIFRLKNELIIMKDSIKSTINEMREIIYNLQPMTLNDLGMVDTLKRFITSMNSVNKMQARIQVSGDERKIDTTIALSLYRIMQEAYSNALNYSNSKDILYDISFEADKIGIVISDYGDGFNIEDCIKKAKDEGHGYGLSIMKERVYLLSGNIDFKSEMGKGTVITIVVPITY